MSVDFFRNPVLNTPYEIPTRHWELDKDGQPTGTLAHKRREAKFVSPIPKPQSRKARPEQGELLNGNEERYKVSPLIQELRFAVDQWRALPNQSDWLVTPETARLLHHWRHHDFQGPRPFFCQVEAAETAIFLTEVAPQRAQYRKFLDHLKAANKEANPELYRLALKLATGAGKTTVMAMLIAWQTINAVRHPGSKSFTRGFLIVAPGLTIKDRLRVLQPNDADSYYAQRELVPQDLLRDLERAKILVTNYHSFKLRERLDISKGGRRLLQGPRGEEIHSLETEGQMIQRVMPDLMGMKNILVINDEAHHCYREKPNTDEEKELSGEEKDEAKKNNEAARLWISGLEIVQRNLGIAQTIDLSATPFFLRGSGYPEGSLFPWAMSDFSLMDAIECGIVKLPRVPVADNLPDSSDDQPKFRNLYENIQKGPVKLPRKGRGKSERLDPLSLPTLLVTAIDALYGHYEKTFELWRKHEIAVPPCFIVVCNNTSTSKLVYDYLSGFDRPDKSGHETHVPGRKELFRNFDEHGTPLPKPRTLLIDSEQLESGDALDDNFRAFAADEIDRFRRELKQRGEHAKAENLSDADLLREVMNTVGKAGRLGESIRCVVSVSMLTEGWDANTVTHVLGVRAFGTQLLCEQVIGRALRRQSYDNFDEDKRLRVEYADILGIPFDFTSEPVIVTPQPPVDSVLVHAVRPERDHLEIRFPRVAGYRVDLPEERIDAEFTKDHVLELTPELVGPTHTRNAGLIGEAVDLSLESLKDQRDSTVLMRLTTHMLYGKWRDENDEPKLHLFGKLKRIAREWMETCLVCKGDTYPAQLLYREIADMASERITAAITRRLADKSPIKVILDPYNREGSTKHVRYTTTKPNRWKPAADRCHLNWLITDSAWEQEFCRIAEQHPRVKAYVKNYNLGFEVPYQYGSQSRRYRPDFILQLDDGLNLIVEVKGFRKEDAKDKKNTMESYWIPGVNHDGRFGRWAFAEFTDVFEMEPGFEKTLAGLFDQLMAKAGHA